MTQWMKIRECDLICGRNTVYNDSTVPNPIEVGRTFRMTISVKLDLRRNTNQCGRRSTTGTKGGIPLGTFTDFPVTATHNNQCTILNAFDRGGRLHRDHRFIHPRTEGSSRKFLAAGLRSCAHADQPLRVSAPNQGLTTLYRTTHIRLGEFDNIGD